MAYIIYANGLQSSALLRMYRRPNLFTGASVGKESVHIKKYSQTMFVHNNNLADTKPTINFHKHNLQLIVVFNYELYQGVSEDVRTKL